MTTEPTPSPGTADAPLPTPPLPAKPSAWPLRYDVVIFVLLLVLSFFVASFSASNSDLWMHLAIGKRITDGNFTFGVDPYSWATEAFGDQPAVYWTHHSWLYSWLVYHLYNLVGGVGLVIGKAILFTLTIALLSRIGGNAANRWFLLICLVMAALACAHRLLLQPVVVSFFFLSVTLYILYRVGVFANRESGEAIETAGNEVPGRFFEASLNGRLLWALPPLFALWANLDHWFILGPMMVAICWMGTGLGRWFPSGNPLPGKMLGAVLGVGLLACLCNPHHIHVFELPPELAYLVLSVADPLSIPLPNGLVAGGRALKVLHATEYDWTISTMSGRYYSESRTGLNIAGMSVFFLFVLGLVSFTLMAFVRPLPKAPALQVNRFLLWLVFGVLALSLYRLIPFFALIAAPLTAMTLGEFLLWQQTCNGVSPERRDRGLDMARFTSVPFLLLLLYFAWPGWLTGPFDNYASPRRVAWTFTPDPSMVQAAVTLKELNDRGECRNVFNSSFDQANYLPWFAPNVQYFMDTRFSLYGSRTAEFVKTRTALMDESKPAEDWRSLFVERDIDHALLSYPLRVNQAKAPPRAYKWWLDPEQWRQRYGDDRIMVFSWAGAPIMKERAGAPWDAEIVRRDWNRQAFAPMPEDMRPPLKGIDPPQPRGHLSLYLDGVGLTPVAALQVRAFHEYYNLQAALGVKNVAPILIASTFGSLAAPDGGSLVAPMVPIFSINEQARNALEYSTRRAMDYGPPAMPILMIRAARRAMAANPNDLDSQRMLLTANMVLRIHQEDHWAGQAGNAGFQHPSQTRDRLRQTQFVAGLYELSQLQPDSYQQQKLIADFYRQSDLLDSALEHMLVAEKALAVHLTTSSSDVPKDAKTRDAYLKGFHDQMVVPLDQQVRERMAKLKERNDLTPLQQAIFAFQGQYETLNEKGNIERSPMGLSKQALEILHSIKPDSLKDEEKADYLSLNLDLLLRLGRVGEVASALKDPGLRNALHPLMLATYEILTAGVLGNYETVDNSLAVFEAEIRKGITSRRDEVRFWQLQCAPPMFLVPLNPSISGLVGGSLLTVDSQRKLIIVTAKLQQDEQDLYNTMTLRGIIALETGDTKRAREIFAATLDEANDTRFSDRRIARRYLDLLIESQ